MRSRTPASRSNARRSITAPPKNAKLLTSPKLNDSVTATNSSLTPDSHSERGTYARAAAEHFCPWYSKAPRTSAVTSDVGSALGCATTKSFPPVSPTSRGYVAYEPIRLPTSRPPPRRGVGGGGADPFADLPPQVLERSRGAGEVDPGQRRVRQGGLAD